MAAMFFSRGAAEVKAIWEPETQWPLDSPLMPLSDSNKRDMTEPTAKAWPAERGHAGATEWHRIQERKKEEAMTKHAHLSNK